MPFAFLPLAGLRVTAKEGLKSGIDGTGRTEGKIIGKVPFLRGNGTGAVSWRALTGTKRRTAFAICHVVKALFRRMMIESVSGTVNVTLSHHHKIKHVPTLPLKFLKKNSIFKNK